MRKVELYIILITGLLFHSCRSEIHQFLPGGERNSKNWFEPTPFGMVYIKSNSFLIGPSDDQVVNISNKNKRVSVSAFWMDDTEITNNEYRQFVYWVRDSIAHKLLGRTYPDFLNTENKHGIPLENPTINWSEKIEWDDPDYRMAMEELYIPEEERLAFHKEIDTRKLVYDYYYVDYKQAARRENSYNFETQKYEGTITNERGEDLPIVNRSSFLIHETIPVYPDTLCWIRDFTYTYNDPFTLKYFSHVAFDDYPLVGVTWKQAKAFCNWRTDLYKDFSSRLKESPPHDYRLPTEVEWEVAARGGLQNNIYPWGSYYVRNVQGCYVANLKPMRGNYVADSPTTTTAMKVGQFEPNDYGLYDMAGNVAEWTSTAFYEAAYDVMHDFNPEIQYDAAADDHPVMKRKVIRGGSWKDIRYFIRNATRSYEYQDTAKSYIGFRCVRSSFKDALLNK